VEALNRSNSASSAAIRFWSNRHTVATRMSVLAFTDLAKPAGSAYTQQGQR
jgi:hypothetical protein